MAVPAGSSGLAPIPRDCTLSSLLQHFSAALPSAQPETADTIEELLSALQELIALETVLSQAEGTHGFVPPLPSPELSELLRNSLSQLYWLPKLTPASTNTLSRPALRAAKLAAELISRAVQLCKRPLTEKSLGEDGSVAELGEKGEWRSGMREWAEGRDEIGLEWERARNSIWEGINDHLEELPSSLKKRKNSPPRTVLQEELFETLVGVFLDAGVCVAERLAASGTIGDGISKHPENKAVLRRMLPAQLLCELVSANVDRAIGHRALEFGFRLSPASSPGEPVQVEWVKTLFAVRAFGTGAAELRARFDRISFDAFEQGANDILNASSAGHLQRSQPFTTTKLECFASARDDRKRVFVSDGEPNTSAGAGPGLLGWHVNRWSVSSTLPVNLVSPSQDSDDGLYPERFELPFSTVKSVRLDLDHDKDELRVVIRTDCPPTISAETIAESGANTVRDPQEWSSVFTMNIGDSQENDLRKTFAERAMLYPRLQIQDRTGDVGGLEGEQSQLTRRNPPPLKTRTVQGSKPMLTFGPDYAPEDQAEGDSSQQSGCQQPKGPSPDQRVRGEEMLKLMSEPITELDEAEHVRPEEDELEDDGPKIRSHHLEERSAARGGGDNLSSPSSAEAQAQASSPARNTRTASKQPTPPPAHPPSAPNLDEQDGTESSPSVGTAAPAKELYKGKTYSGQVEKKAVAITRSGRQGKAPPKCPIVGAEDEPDSQRSTADGHGSDDESVYGEKQPAKNKTKEQPEKQPGPPTNAQRPRSKQHTASPAPVKLPARAAKVGTPRKPRTKADQSAKTPAKPAAKSTRLNSGLSAKKIVKGRVGKKSAAKSTLATTPKSKPQRSPRPQRKSVTKKKSVRDATDHDELTSDAVTDYDETSVSNKVRAKRGISDTPTAPASKKVTTSSALRAAVAKPVPKKAGPKKLTDSQKAGLKKQQEKETRAKAGANEKVGDESEHDTIEAALDQEERAAAAVQAEKSKKRKAIDENVPTPVPGKSRFKDGKAARDVLARDQSRPTTTDDEPAPVKRRKLSSIKELIELDGAPPAEDGQHSEPAEGGKQAAADGYEPPMEVDPLEQPAGVGEPAADEHDTIEGSSQDAQPVRPSAGQPVILVGETPSQQSARTEQAAIPAIVTANAQAVLKNDEPVADTAHQGGNNITTAAKPDDSSAQLDRAVLSAVPEEDDESVAPTEVDHEREEEQPPAKATSATAQPRLSPELSLTDILRDNERELAQPRKDHELDIGSWQKGVDAAQREDNRARIRPILPADAAHAGRSREATRSAKLQPVPAAGKATHPRHHHRVPASEKPPSRFQPRLAPKPAAPPASVKLRVQPQSQTQGKPKPQPTKRTVRSDRAQTQASNSGGRTFAAGDALSGGTADEQLILSAFKAVLDQMRARMSRRARAGRESLATLLENVRTQLLEPEIDALSNYTIALGKLFEDALERVNHLRGPILDTLDRLEDNAERVPAVKAAFLCRSRAARTRAGGEQ